MKILFVKQPLAKPVGLLMRLDNFKMTLEQNLTLKLNPAEGQCVLLHYRGGANSEWSKIETL